LLSTVSEAYGTALLLGFQEAAGERILVMDADQAHPTSTLRDLWEARSRAEILIASRYTRGGEAKMPLLRLILSRLLNAVFSRGLDLQVRDMSSGFRLYRTDVLRALSLESKDYDILQEILVKAMMEGYRIGEIPFVYHARSSRSAYERVFKFGLAYWKTFARLWRIRNSIGSADYDARAYDALMPPQRYWQRQRYKHITRLIRSQGRCLDVGCGSSRIIGTLPAGSIALDILMRKLRFSRIYGVLTVQGSLFDLPIPTGSFPCVICSQVIEHVPRAEALSELDRVLAPGGLLVLGTPDYAKWQWRMIEWLYKVILPQAYADEHITHYTYHDLRDEFVNQRGYALEAVRYILQGELILGLRKPAREEGGL
jgi:SAM-dependent methyltransferase